ncbi:MAG: dihydrolipoyl dehydrogenase [Acidobacteriota bacterium]
MADQTRSFDLTVVGSGPGGYVAAIRAAQLGQTVALVEKAPALGGTCLHVGCIPTKALLEAAHVFEMTRRCGEFGITAGDVGFDWPAIQKRKQTVVDGQARGLNFLMKKNKITVFTGAGKLDGPGRVTVTDANGKRTSLTTAHIILATGSRPRGLPHIRGDSEKILDSNDLLELQRVPASLLILGAGAIGMEFASIYARFGTSCTVVEMLPRALPLEDAEVGKEIARAFRKRKITVRTGARVEAVDAAGKQVTARVVPEDGGEAVSLEAELMLVAVGRSPVTGDLGLASAGVTSTDGFIDVDETMRTNVRNIFAIGDIVRLPGRAHPMLAHVASAEGIVAAETVAGVPTRPLNYDRVPSVTYCDPEVASVGLDEATARQQGHEVRVGKFPMSPNARARISGETDGFVKIVAEAHHDEVLGVHIVGPRASELIAEACAALTLETTSEELARTIHAHPTLAEGIGEAAHGVHGNPIHI